MANAIGRIARPFAFRGIARAPSFTTPPRKGQPPAHFSSLLARVETKTSSNQTTAVKVLFYPEPIPLRGSHPDLTMMASPPLQKS